MSVYAKIYRCESPICRNLQCIDGFCVKCFYKETKLFTKQMDTIRKNDRIGGRKEAQGSKEKGYRDPKK